MRSVGRLHCYRCWSVDGVIRGWFRDVAWRAAYLVAEGEIRVKEELLCGQG